jgi:polyphosphate:AMP phosphotransferase
MLEDLDLEAKVSREDYQRLSDELELRLGSLQRRVRTSSFPVLIVFEGFDAAGKGTVINHLMRALDPRGFKVWTTMPPDDGEKLHPFLWRFWDRTPTRGAFAIFDRSWYAEPLASHTESKPCATDGRFIPDIRSFERQLTDDGAVVIKFFLHISREDQKKRLKELADNPDTAWRVTREDRRQHKRYRRYLRAAETMMAATDDPWAPWIPVAANDRRSATLDVLRNVVLALERGLAKSRAKPTHRRARLKPARSSVLKSVDLSRSISREAYDSRIEIRQNTLRALEYRIHVERVPVVIVFEGWDAAGKGGCIRRLTRRLDPRGYEVAPFGPPTQEEKDHHYLWRFWRKMPKAGHITVFDRSWYGRVLVERVENLCTPEEWMRAYREINEMEASLVRAGTVMLKFWLHTDMAEQLRRFRDRERTPEKRWKISDEDWRNRRQRVRYEQAVEDMLRLTGTRCAPWTMVEANSKHYARIKVLDRTIRAISLRLDGKSRATA